MSPDKLIYMANQIARFFHSQPAEEAAPGVADHINKFWEPRMRTQLFELTDNDTPGFDPIVIAALAEIRRPNAVGGQGV